MILSGKSIRQRIEVGDIIKKETANDHSIKEASYALRLAGDGLLIDGAFYDPGEHYKGAYVTIQPGNIAILSTLELLKMPADLLGKVGLRFDYAVLGLTGLMGIQVDPLYGQEQDGQRLFIRVANFGNEPIRLSVGDEVFTFELHEVSGKVCSTPKDATWMRIKDRLKNQSDPSWSYVTRVEQNLKAETDRIQEYSQAETGRLRDYLQPVVLFGVFLVAVTILGVTVTTLIQLTGSKDLSKFPTWQQVFFAVILGLGAFGAACVGFATLWRSFRPYERNNSNSRRISE